jgi:DNA polymerase I-like protein with 3'-5' exonuclease and polymerase domains
MSVQYEDVVIYPPEAVPTPLGPVASEFFQSSSRWGGAAPLYQQFIKELLFRRNMLPTSEYDKNLNFIPGSQLGGRVGPYSDIQTMLVFPMPNLVQGDTRYGDEPDLGFHSVVADLLGDYLPVLKAAFEELGVPPDVYLSFYATTLVRFPKPVYSSKGGIQVRWIKEGVHLLHHELAMIQPKYIAAFGTEPSKFFTTYTISKSQSMVFDYKVNEVQQNAARLRGFEPPEDELASVVCVPDPKTVILNAEKKPQFIAGIDLFKTVVTGAERLQAPDVHEVYVEDERTLETAVDVLLERGVDTFAIDCEWGGKHWLDVDAGLRTVQIAWSGSDVLVVILRREGMRPAFSPTLSSAFMQLRRLLQRPEVRIIGHNIAADYPWLEDQGVDLSSQLYFDTMLASHVFEPTASHGLEDLAVRFIPGWPRHDIHIEEWKKQVGYSNDMLNVRGYADIPDDVLHPYAGRDACATFLLYKLYFAKFAEPGNEGLRKLFNELVMPATLAFINIETTGIQIDQTQLKLLEDRYHELHSDLLSRFRTAVGDPSFNPDSAPQKHDLLFNTLGLTPVKTTGKYPKQWSDVVMRGETQRHTPACDGETLEILGHKNKIADMLREVCLLGTVTKVFLPRPAVNKVTKEVEYQSGFAGFLKRDGRLHTKIGQMVKTGRLSSSSPNLQNAPSKTEDAIKEVFLKYRKDQRFYKLRTVFTAGEGKLLVCCDYKQAEIAALAYLSGDPTLIAAVKEGKDIHSVVCKQMFNLECELAEVKVKHKSLRIAAKAIVFGLIYGRGASAIAREVQKAGVDCTVERAQTFIDTFLNQFPMVKALIEKSHEQVETIGYVEGAWGRRAQFYSTGSKDNDKVLARQKRQAVNFLPQNYVADLLRKALINLFAYRREHYGEVDFDVVLTVYDSVIFEVPVKHVQRLVEEVVPECMEKNAYSDKCPFSVAVDTDVYRRWDEPMHLADLVDLGLEEDFAKQFAVTDELEDGTVVYP